jgi:hypothetical protein
MDCGWQNPEPAGRNHSLKSLASNEDCIERAAPPQTSDMRDVLSRFAMMISLQLTSDPSTIVSLRDTSCPWWFMIFLRPIAKLAHNPQV